MSGGATRTTGAGTALRWDGLENGVAYRFRLQAVNQAEEPSEWSGWSTDTVPAGKAFAPGTPSAVKATSAVFGGVVRVSWATATPQQGSVKFTWNRTNATTIGNGREVTITPVVNTQQVANDGEYITDRYRAARDFTMTIRVCATGTEDCETTQKRATSLPIPDPSVRISQGRSVDGIKSNCGPGKEFENCNPTHFEIAGFDAGPVEVTCVAVGAEGTSSAGREYEFITGTMTIPESGSYTGTPGMCIMHDDHAQLFVRIKEYGLESNRLTR